MKVPYHTIVAEPAVEPVTVNQLAFNVRLIVDEAENYAGPELALLGRLITAARKDVENYTGMAVIHQKWRVNYPCFSRAMALCRGLVSVESVKYLQSGNEQLMPSGDYSVVANQLVDYVIIERFATKVDNRADAVEIVFTTGMGATSDDVPGEIKQAIIMLASHFYQNREATSPLKINNVPLSYKWLLPPPLPVV